MHWLHRKRIPWIFWGEIPGMTQRRSVGAGLRRLAQLPAIKWSHGIAAIGSGAVEAYKRLSGGRCPVANVPYCCDLQPFLEIRRDRIRSGDRTRFLYCGQLIHRKGVDVLLEAYCRAAAKCPRIELIIVGEGPLGAALKEQVPETLRTRIQFTGFRPIADLPELFADADVFVLPSRHDGWGVVINQAAAAGMPIISSDAVGAAADLVVENDNGFVCTAGSIDSLERAMETLANDRERIHREGLRSREMAMNWTTEKTVERWHQFLESVFAAKSHPLGRSGSIALRAAAKLR